MSLPTWVLESNVFSEACFDAMVAHLKRIGAACHIVRIIPFVHEIVGEPPAIAGPVICYGSIGIGKVARQLGWAPGVFTGSFDYGRSLSWLGSNMLNHDAQIVPIGDVVATARSRGWDEIFVRPNGDLKEFPGSIISLADFEEWYGKLEACGWLAENTGLAVIASPKNIDAEYRIVMVDGRAVAGSTYRVGGRTVQEAGMPDHVGFFAEQMHQKYRPCDVYVVDIAKVVDRLRVIEHNTFNHSGLYQCDVGKIIDAINAKFPGA